MSIFSSKIEMNVSNSNIARGRSNLSSKSTSRSSLILSNTSSVSYYECMEIDSNKLENINMESIKSFQLSFTDNSNNSTLVSRVADNSSTDKSKHVFNEASTSVPIPSSYSPNNNISESNNSKQSLININLLYNMNQAIYQDIWNRNFQLVSLHGILEHLPLDIENIKVSIYYISKYILNRFVERGKVNDFDDLNDVGKVVWEFISTFYNSGWNTLHIENKVFLRNKVASKFTLKTINTPKLRNTKTTKKLALVSFLSFSILAKSLKEVRDLTKFFKKNNCQDR